MQEPKLAELLTLEKLDEGFYRGKSWDLGFRALFGGQVMGQSLAAAQYTVAENLSCHSFHCYFILPGDVSAPVLYQVENVRDGRSFSTRRTKAIQHGKVIFDSMSSFQVQEKGMEHQTFQLPDDIPPPEDIEPDIKGMEHPDAKISMSLREKLIYHKPIDLRSVKSATNYKDAKRYTWMRLKEPVEHNNLMHQTALSYASDYHLLLTSLQPHGVSPNDKDLRLATIDHAVWFHYPLDFNEWHLYCVDSPSAGGARGYVRGQFFDRHGKLVASTTQEGLIRMVGDKAIKS
ncbi:acyl-CoA thioesterase II [Paraneptunicella aestuarii]|uniref:acyl-CoA thioesterase n=1 Tax=Paraneptunicella aestuarii TaxID=2831148 RepID=UPI001E50EF63|nr:acyl-CoA thioesterase II [Paraneptunicella aestuarii]UAA40311.1 acyl-CoA thioesterase II [Paraneptunicella aestuarii]